MPGYVYGVYNPFSKLIKVGLTTFPKNRIRNIEVSGGVNVEIVAVIRVANPRTVEAEIHAELMKCRKLGEWFDCDRDIVKGMLYAKARREVGKAAWGRKKYFRKANFFTERWRINMLEDLK